MNDRTKKWQLIGLLLGLLVAVGDWESLEALQDELQGRRRV